MNVSGLKNQITVKNSVENEDKTLKKACRDFEGILVHFMLKSMRKTLAGDSIFGDSMGKDIYQSMYDEHLAQEISSGENNVGLGDALYRQLKKDDPIRPEDQKRIKDSRLHLELMTDKIPKVR